MKYPDDFNKWRKLQLHSRLSYPQVSVDIIVYKKASVVEK